MNIKKTIVTATVALTMVAMIAPMAASADTMSDLQAQINALMAQLNALQGSTTVSGTVPAACVGITFSRNLRVGMTGADVKCFQVLLNGHGYTVALSGAGSSGNETSYFGPLTLAAVKKWQAAQGWTPADQIGPLSRGLLNSWLAGSTTGTTPNVPVQTGPVSVMLSSDSPAAGMSIVGGQATADLAHFTFSGSGTVTSVTLKRSGISDQNTLTNVYLYDGNTRLTDGYSFNVNGQIVINGLNIAVNGSKVISVRADVYSSAADTASSIAVAVTGYTANGTTSSVSVQGNMMYVVVGSLATITFNAANSGAGGPSGTPSVNAGTSAYTFWSQSVQVSTRAVWLKAANFRMVGSAPSDSLANVKLYIDGVDTGKVANLIVIQGSNYLTFDLSSAPISLMTGSHTLDVRGDIQKGSNRTVQLSVQQAADLMVYDQQIGVNIAIGTSGSGAIPSSGGTVSISTGSVTVINETAFNATTNVTGGGSNAVIAKFKLHAYGEDVKVNSVKIAPVLTTATAGANSTDSSGVCNGTCGLQNVTLYFNGSQVGTQTNISGATAFNGTTTTQTFTLGSQMIVPAGTDSWLEVRTDLATTGGTNYTLGTVGANLVSVASTAQGQNSLATITFPSSSITGHTLSLQTGTLGISKNPGYSSQSAAPNTSAVKIGSFVLQNTSTSESVRITSLVVNLAYGAGAGSTNLSALRTSEASGSGASPQVPTTASASSNGDNTFSVDTTLAPGATKTVDVFADSGSSTGATVTVTTSLNVSYIGVSSNVSTTTGSTGGQVITFATGTLGLTPTKVASTTSVSQYVASAGGSTDGSRNTFNITASSASATITELKFTATGTTTGIASVRVGSTSAPVISGTAWLTGLSIPVPNGGSGVNIDAYASYPDVSINGILSGSTSTVNLQYVKFTSGGNTKTLCTSSCDYTLNGGSVVASNAMTLVGSKPSVTLTLPNGVSGTSQSGLSVGTIYVGDVKVSADAKGDIKLNTLQVSFLGNASGTTVDGTATVIKDATGTTVSGASVTGNGGDDANTYSTITFSGGYTVAAGTTQTFQIYAVVSARANSTGGDSVSLGMSGNSGAAAFTWTDSAGNGTSAAGAGSLITNFPTTTVVTRSN